MADIVPEMIVVPLPTAAKTPVAAPHLTKKQLAERGIPRIVPGADRAVRISDTAFGILLRAMFEQLTADQRAAAVSTVARRFNEAGDDQARAAFAFIAGVL